MPGLGELGQALLMKRRGDTGGAAGLLRKLGAAENQATIRVESLSLLAEVYVDRGNMGEAVRTYKLIGDSIETPSAASALEAVGDIYLGLGRVEDAVKAYEDVILKFPDSVSAGEARRKIDLATREPDDEA